MNKHNQIWECIWNSFASNILLVFDLTLILELQLYSTFKIYGNNQHTCKTSMILSNVRIFIFWEHMWETYGNQENNLTNIWQIMWIKSKFSQFDCLRCFYFSSMLQSIFVRMLYDAFLNLSSDISDKFLNDRCLKENLKHVH